MNRHMQGVGPRIQQDEIVNTQVAGKGGFQCCRFGSHSDPLPLQAVADLVELFRAKLRAENLDELLFCLQFTDLSESPWHGLPGML